MSFVEQNPLSEHVESETPPAEAPVAETPPEGAETPPVAETPPAETPEDYGWVTEFGGKEAIEDAVAIANALRDEEGVRALVEEGLKHMGYDPSKVFNPEAPAGDPDEFDPDEPITQAQLDARLDALTKQQAEQAQQVRIQVAAEAVDQTRQALNITDETEWDLVRTFAQRHTTPTELDPQALSDAVRKGYEDMKVAVAATAKKYVQDRAEVNSGVPAAVVGGGVGGGEEAPAPPKNLEEARKAARAYLAENQ